MQQCQCASSQDIMLLKDMPMVEFHMILETAHKKDFGEVTVSADDLTNAVNIVKQSRLQKIMRTSALQVVTSRVCEAIAKSTVDASITSRVNSIMTVLAERLADHDSINYDLAANSAAEAEVIDSSRAAICRLKNLYVELNQISARATGATAVAIQPLVDKAAGFKSNVIAKHSDFLEAVFWRTIERNMNNNDTWQSSTNLQCLSSLEMDSTDMYSKDEQDSHNAVIEQRRYVYNSVAAIIAVDFSAVTFDCKHVAMLAELHSLLEDGNTQDSSELQSQLQQYFLCQ